MSQLQFSWRNQKGYGLALLFYGWALIIQIPAFYHALTVIHLPAANNDWMIFLGTIILVTTIIGSFLASIYENLFNPFEQTLTNIHTVVLATFIVYYVFYILSVPTIQTLEPFLGLPTSIPFFGWGQYMVSIVTGLIGVTIFWYITEMRKNRPRPTA